MLLTCGTLHKSDVVFDTRHVREQEFVIRKPQKELFCLPEL